MYDNFSMPGNRRPVKLVSEIRNDPVSKTTHEKTSRCYQPHDGSAEPHSPDRRMSGTLPAHPDPNNVRTPVTSATQTQARPNISPDVNKDKIDHGWCKEKEREERLQNLMG